MSYAIGLLVASLIMFLTVARIFIIVTDATQYMLEGDDRETFGDVMIAVSTSMWCVLPLIFIAGILLGL